MRPKKYLKEVKYNYRRSQERIGLDFDKLNEKEVEEVKNYISDVCFYKILIFFLRDFLNL